MENGLGQYAPQIIAMLLGGLSTSLGTTWALRKGRGHETLVKAKGAGIALYAVVSLILGGGAVYWMVTSMLDSITGLPELASAGVMLTWTDARAGEEKKRKRKDRVVTKDDRRAFADDLARQLKDLGDPDRDVKVSIAGDGGTVLKLEGKINAKEAERLTADMKDVGFKRVEAGGAKRWWVHV